MSKVDSLTFQLRLKTTELNKAVEEGDKNKIHAAELRNECKALEQTVKDKNQTISAYKMQLKHLNDCQKSSDEAKEEARNLRKKLTTLER